MKKERILYISQSILYTNTGGGLISKRNLKMVLEVHKDACIDSVVLGPESTDIDFVVTGKIFDFRSKYSKLNTLVNILRGYTTGINATIYKKIQRVILEGSYDYIFIDGSLFGRIVRFVKKQTEAKTMVFYHNIERDFWRDSLRTDGKKFLPVYLNACYNERLSSKYADSIALISKDDIERFKQLYKRNVDLILPVSIEVNEKMNLHSDLKSSAGMLFVGSAFFANIEAVKWFVDSVLPYVNLNLTVVGKGMDKALENLHSPKLKVLGYVDDLASVYSEHQLVIAPIFHGAGMKVKIAEAMMHGKYILGSDLAFSGYEINSDVVTICNDANAYIYAIESFRKELLFNEKSWQFFNSHYSYKAVVNKYSTFINSN